MKTYGKWEWSGSDYRRKVSSKVFGFLRETWEVATPQHFERSDARLLRVLNREPEPEVKLDESYPYYISLYGTGLQGGGYRFPTDALKAELKRRGEKKL